MRARYIGNPKRAGEGPEVTTTFGLTFLKGAWVSLDKADPVAIRKLKNNPFFEVDEGMAASGQPTAAKSAPQQEPPKQAESEPIPDDWREAHHSKRMKWARQLGGAPANAEEANTIIEKHLATTAPAIEPAKPSIVDPPSTDGEDDWGDLDPV